MVTFYTGEQHTTSELKILFLRCVEGLLVSSSKYEWQYRWQEYWHCELKLRE